MRLITAALWSGLLLSAPSSQEGDIASEAPDARTTSCSTGGVL